MNKKIQRLEEVAINAFPALSTEIYDGWILTYSNGYTYRGNCINPLYMSSYDLDEKIKYCEDKYFNYNLPCVFKLNENVDGNLDELLENKGYTIKKKVNIMEMNLGNMELSVDNDVNIQYSMTEEWLDKFIILNDTEEEKNKTSIKAMLNNIQEQIICASIIEDKKMVACGLGVLEDKKIGLYDIRVSAAHRRKGLGKKICKRIIEEGIKKSANTAYLQVAATNDIAIRMYEVLGFSNVYTYWYRVKEFDK